MEAILEPLLRSPQFLRYVDELNEMRNRESEARQRFRSSLDEDVRAEFINGEVVIQMPARDLHMTTVRNLARLVDIFVQVRGLGAVRTEQALTEFPRNDYCPDICFWNSEKSSSFSKSTTVYPIPDLIVEVISPTTEARDRGTKFEDYAAQGVGEYWIVDPDARVLEQYLGRSGKFELVAKFNAGTIRSRTIEGFEFLVRAVFDDQANLTEVRKILAS